MPIYPKSNIALLDARCVAITWILMGLLAVSWLSSRWLSVGPMFVFQVNFALFLLSATTHILLSLQHRCPACGKHPTIQGFKAVHPNSTSQSALSGWGGVIVNVLRRRRLVCIHCGAGYVIQS